MEVKLLNELFVKFSELSSIKDKKKRDMQICRLSMIAELDASNFYEGMIELATDKRLKKMLQDVSHEEKVHVGEFKHALENLDPEYNKAEKRGEKEAKKRVKESKTLKEAGFEKDPKGWDKSSLQKYMKTFSKKMKGGVKSPGFFDKCVKKVQGRLKNPEGFCAALKDESYGSTGWRGKDKPPKEVAKDVKKAKFKVESDQAINQYLDFISEGGDAIKDESAPLPNELINVLEYNERPNWIGYCVKTYDGNPDTQVKCLQAVREYAAANPFYQYRIDRYIDVILGRRGNQDDLPYPQQNPDSREVNLGTSGSPEKGYSNMDHETPGVLETGMAGRVPSGGLKCDLDDGQGFAEPTGGKFDVNFEDED